jgi:hypothetical protein
MEITQVQNNGTSSVYLLHRTNSTDTVQYKLWGKQTSVSARIYNIQRLQHKQDFGDRCREKAAFSKEQSKAQAIKAITLFMMTNPEKFKNKTALIKGLKKFADSVGVKVSEKKIAEQFDSIRGLVQ